MMTTMQLLLRRPPPRSFPLPQLGHSATSPLLSDKAAHPYFSRVVPPDTYQGTALAGIVRQLGWRRIGVVSTTDEYALEISRVFRAALDEPPVVLVQYALLASYDGISLRPQCETVLQSLVRVVALLAPRALDGAAAARAGQAARHRHLLDPGVEHVARRQLVAPVGLAPPFSRLDRARALAVCAHHRGGVVSGRR